MTRKELSRKYWKYYRMLEDRFLYTGNFVEINPSNFLTFSNEYALLIQGIGAELDNFFKIYCGLETSDRKTIADYSRFILSDYPDIVNDTISVLGTEIKVTPFEKWNIDSPAKSLTWWQAYDDVKHNRSENFVEANQENVLNILGALYLLEMKMFVKVKGFNPITKMEDIPIPSEESKLFGFPTWDNYFFSADDIRMIEEMS